ncbi:hypothetical protein GCM10009675_48740 [Prauserella alba]|uniref:Uncharacterized protein n=1 Tax=Prauserella alba TaxID=176898 RepID=A0ABN1VRJ7_9PSEU
MYTRRTSASAACGSGATGIPVNGADIVTGAASIPVATLRVSCSARRRAGAPETPPMGSAGPAVGPGWLGVFGTVLVTGASGEPKTVTRE